MIHQYLKPNLTRAFSLFAVTVVLALSACTNQKSVSEEYALQRPHVDLPAHEVPAPEKKPLIGLFVDAASTATSPDGKSWKTAFPNIMAAINASTGQNIYIAAGTYKSPRIDLDSRSFIRLVAGYKSGALYEKDNYDAEPDERAILDGEGLNQPLVNIYGNSHTISFLGGFVFRNTLNESAVLILGKDVANPVKNIMIVNSRFENNDAGAGSHGGGLRINFAEDLRLDDLNAIKNKAGSKGGFIFLDSSDE